MLETIAPKHEKTTVQVLCIPITEQPSTPIM